MCQHTLFDLAGVEIHKYKRSKQCWRCRRYSTDFKALSAMYVEDLEDGVCSFYATLHTEYCYSSHSCLKMSKMPNTIVLCIQGPSPLQGGRLFIWAFHPVGLVVHNQSVWGGSFVNFLGLDNYKGDCRQDAQPIPNS